MFSQKDLEMFNDAIKQMEQDNDDFYLKQCRNIKESNLSYDDLIRLAACFYTQKYRIIRKQNKQQSLQRGNSAKAIHPAYKAEVTPQLVYDTYVRCDNNKCETARLLGIQIKTVYKRLKEYNDQ